MPDKKLEFDLEGIDYDKLNTEADFKKEAKRLLPAAMNMAGSKVAEAFWKTTHKSLGLTNSQKKDFIKEAEIEFAKSPKECVRVEKMLIAKLKEGKRKHRSKE
ncbi:hypothetical protein [Gimesia sp.]|uniref:hypothetical protein n=1 Tax=Gimesia sp. TaxID=2024833 RepID=UPI0032EDD1EA